MTINPISSELFRKHVKACKSAFTGKLNARNQRIMGENAVNIGHIYFRFAQILIMKIIWTDIHGHYSHNVVKFFLVCTRFHNEKSDIRTTQEDQRGKTNGVPN